MGIWSFGFWGFGDNTQFYIKYKNIFKISYNFLGYFSFSVAKHSDQSNLEKKGFNWAASFKAIESMAIEQRHGVRNSWKLKSWSISWRQGEHWEEWFETSRFHLQWCTSFHKASPPNISQAVTPTVDQTFKHISLRRLCLFKLSLWCL